MRSAILALLGTVLLSLGGCNKYILDVKSSDASQPKDSNAPEQGKIPSGLSSSDLYVTIYASAASPSGLTPLDPCHEDFAVRYLAKVQKNISISALIQGSTPMPLYTVSANNQACDILYDKRYLTPWTPQNIQNFQINETYLYNVDTQQTISNFIAAAGNFAGAIAPQAKPAVAGLDVALNSTFANTLITLYNSSESQKASIGTPLATLATDNLPNWGIRTYEYDMLAHKVNSNYEYYNPDQVFKLGTLTVIIERRLTLLGRVQTDALPDFGDVTPAKPIRVLVPSAQTGVTAADKPVKDLVSAPLNVVLGLPDTAKAPQIEKACDDLRGALDNIPLNRLDRSVYLWRVVAKLGFGAKESHDPAKPGPCLNADEIKLINQLNLFGWATTS